jgi:hypothetical protein
MPWIGSEILKSSEECKILGVRAEWHPGCLPFAERQTAVSNAGDEKPATRTPYTLYRLAPGSYDIDLNGHTFGCLVRTGNGWVAELLSGSGNVMPLPLTKPEHEFDLLAEAFIWLGRPPQKKRWAMRNRIGG